MAQMSEQNVDQELVERVQRGDKNAYNLLVTKYQHKVASLVSRYVRNQSDVPDLVQEAFIKAYRALATFRCDSAFYTWLYRIAINTAKNYLTAAARRPPTMDVDAADATNYHDSPELKEFDTPESNLMSAEFEQAIHQAIQALPEDTATAIKLREFEGMSYEEISQAMDCPIGTVRSRIFRAREAIDNRVNEIMNQGEQQ